MHTDSELLRLYVEQADQRSFAELVERHLPVVFNAALRRTNGNRPLAEEATQLVFTQLATKASRLQRHPALLGWLHTSTRFAAASLLRREQRQATRNQTAAAMGTEEDRAPDWDAIRPLIDESLDRLAPTHRQAVLLRYFAGRSYSEIGGDLNVSENAARKCVERAVDGLRRQFARRGITTSASALAAVLSTASAHASAPPAASTIAATASAHAASVAGGGIAEVLALMTAAKHFTTAAVVIAFVGIGTIGITWSQQQDRERRQLAAWDAQTRTMRTTLARVGRETPAPLPAGKPTPTPAEAGTAAKDQWIENRLRRAYLLITDPAYVPIRRQEQRLQFRQEFGAFQATRNFSHEQVEALRQAAMDRYEAHTVHRAEAWLDPQKLANLRRTEIADDNGFYERLRSIFTDAEQVDIRRCFDCQRMMPVTQPFIQWMEFDGAPPDRVQELALAMVISDAENARRNASPEQRRQLDAVDASTQLSLSNQKQLEDAAVFLSPEQLRLYESYLKRENMASEAKKRAAALYRQSHPRS